MMSQSAFHQLIGKALAITHRGKQRDTTTVTSYLLCFTLLQRATA